MRDELQPAFERAGKQPESEQVVLARVLTETIDADSRWDELLHEPQGLTVLERMAAEAHEEYLRSERRDLDELLAVPEDPDDKLP